jgi:hypothetical protein
MVYLIVVSVLVLWIMSLIGLGRLISTVLFKPDERAIIFSRPAARLAVLGFLGLLFASIVATIINFFFPIDERCSIALGLLGLTSFVPEIKDVLESFSIEDWLATFILVLSLSVLPFSPLLDYDVGAYHLQTIKWLNSQPVPLGLVNLLPRSAFPTSWFPLVSLVDVIVLQLHSPNFICGALCLFFYCSASLEAVRRWFSGDWSLSNVFLGSTMAPAVLQTRYWVNSSSPDLPMMLLICFVIYLVVRGMERPEERDAYLDLALVFAAFGTSIKLYGAPLLAATFIIKLASCAFNSNRILQWQGSDVFRRVHVGLTKSLLVMAFILLPWVARGISLSGCVVYPLPSTCFVQLKWAASQSDVVTMSSYIRAWAKKPGDDPWDSLESNQWIGPWVNKYSKHLAIYGVLFALGTFCLVGGSLKHGWSFVTSASFIVPVLVSIFCLLCWFFSAPHPRFAHGFLFSFNSLIFCQGIRSVMYSREPGIKNERSRNIASVLSNWFFCCLLVVILAAHNPRSFGETFTWSTFPPVSFTKITTDTGLSINVPKGDQCWDCPLPCTSSPSAALRARMGNNGRYEMFWLDTAAKAGK